MSLRIGIVTSLFNSEVTLKLEEGALQFFQKSDIPEKNIIKTYVPGAFEIPLIAQALFEYQKVDAVVALGAVIKGETSHYDYVCEAVTRGCLDVSLKYGKPVGFGVLTTENEEQALERAGGRHGNKGYDTAEAVFKMCGQLKDLQK